MKINIKNLFSYVSPFLWMSFIFYLSSFPGSTTSDPHSYNQIILRKLAHIFEFGILALLLFKLFRKLKKKKRTWNTYFLWIIGIIFLFALSDEIHQSFVSGRRGRAEDFLLDVSSACLILQLLSYKKVELKRKIKIGIIIFCLAIFSFSLILLLGEGQSKEEMEKYYREKWERENAPQEIENEKSDDYENNLEENTYNNNYEEKTISESKEEKNEIPEKFIIENVPFTSQAPFALWDEVHEESCEEASLIMLEYFQEEKNLTKEKAEAEIQKMVAYQIEKYGDYKDSDAQEISKLARDFYGLDLEVVYNFSLEDLKKELALGKPIIVPAAGRELGNPFFTPPGPLYHNLVVIGYDKNNFITNDPGTKRGERYVYDEEILYEAIHDFPGKKEDILKGEKAMLILK